MSEKILIFDDDEDIALVLQNQLQHNGYELVPLGDNVIKLKASLHKKSATSEKNGTPKHLTIDYMNIVKKKLSTYGFDSKPDAYDYLCKTIHYLLTHPNTKHQKLTAIFTEIAYIQVNSVFNGISRLIATTYEQNKEAFKAFASPPSVKKFILFIVNDIQQQITHSPTACHHCQYHPKNAKK